MTMPDAITRLKTALEKERADRGSFGLPHDLKNEAAVSAAIEAVEKTLDMTEREVLRLRTRLAALLENDHAD